MEFWFIFFMRVLMLDIGIWRLISLLMDCSCIAPRTPTLIMTRGFVFHPWFCMFLINELYLVCLCTRACSGNLSFSTINHPNTLTYNLHECQPRFLRVWFIYNTSFIQLVLNTMRSYGVCHKDNGKMCFLGIYGIVEFGFTNFM